MESAREKKGEKKIFQKMESLLKSGRELLCHWLLLQEISCGHDFLPPSLSLPLKCSCKHKHVHALRWILSSYETRRHHSAISTFRRIETDL